MNVPVEDQICEQGYGIIKRFVDQARVDELSRCAKRWSNRSGNELLIKNA